jgi:hypothetical protein
LVASSQLQAPASARAIQNRTWVPAAGTGPAPSPGTAAAQGCPQAARAGPLPGPAQTAAAGWAPGSPPGSAAHSMPPEARAAPLAAAPPAGHRRAGVPLWRWGHAGAAGRGRPGGPGAPLGTSAVRHQGGVGREEC